MEEHITGTADSLAGEIVEMREVTKDLAAKEKQKRAELLFRRALGRMKHMSCGKVFAAWTKATSDSTRKRKMARQAINRFKNTWMSQCFNQWAGAVRSARKKKQEAILEEQTTKLQAVLARLDPDGDGVVDQDEFTEWAQIQALRVEAWERKLTAAMSELDTLTDRVESSVDQRTLESLAEELAKQNLTSETKMDELKDDLDAKIVEHGAMLDALAVATEGSLTVIPDGLKEWQAAVGQRIFEQVQPLMEDTRADFEKTVSSLEVSACCVSAGCPICRCGYACVVALTRHDIAIRLVACRYICVRIWTRWASGVRRTAPH
eukprot:COSAG06_NODE_1432_length_9478_cov_5.092014_5_plen_320_part_00